MKTVTFYSFKGGVGRSLALINVGHALARRGLHVVWLDFDLEAPGLGRTPATGGPRATSGLGASDLILGWLDDHEVALDKCVRDVPSAGEGSIRLMTAGRHPEALARRTASLLVDPEAPEAFVFARLKAELEDAYSPDVLLVDSRTGLADVAGVCTVELPDAVVAVSGINEQNVAGMEDVLSRIVAHPFRNHPPALLVALSPVPSRAWMGAAPTLETRHLFLDRHEESALTGATPAAWDRVSARCQAVWHRLLPSVSAAFEEARKLIPELRRTDLLHVLEHDPEVPLLDELLIDRDAPLTSQYERLAESVGAGLLGQERSGDVHATWDPLGPSHHG